MFAVNYLVTHVIDTGDHRPIRQPVRRTPFALRDQIDQMAGTSHHTSFSESVGEPCCPGKEEGWRNVLLHRLQAAKPTPLTRLDAFPLPRIDNTLELL